jgi:hypothetical protein
MEIRVDLPDGKVFGTLTLRINGAVHAEDQLSRDTTWTSSSSDRRSWPALLLRRSPRRRPRGEDACPRVFAEVTADCHRTARRLTAELAKEAGRHPTAEAHGPRIEKLTNQKPLTSFCAAGNFGAAGCDQLATLLEATVSGLVDRSVPAVLREESRPWRTGLRSRNRRTATNKSGSAAQLEPVEAIQPITLAGGAVSLAGTRTGTQGIATVTINPLALGEHRRT